jgi:hypothetical protein
MPLPSARFRSHMTSTQAINDTLSQSGVSAADNRKLAAATAGILGPDHPDTLTTRRNLSFFFSFSSSSSSYRRAGRTADASPLEHIAASSEQILRPRHRRAIAALAGVRGRKHASESPRPEALRQVPPRIPRTAGTIIDGL